MHIRVPLPVAIALIVLIVAVANVAGVRAQGAAAPAASSLGQPFKTLRGVFKYDGTWVTGGTGMTVTVISQYNYRVSFPPGTWTNPKTGVSCSFVPQAEGVIGSAVTTESAWAASPDGSGAFDIGGGGAEIGVVAISATC
jgi:hypothetical protein